LLALVLLVGLGTAMSPAQEEEMAEQSFSAFGVAMGPGISGALQIHITRWSTNEERQALANALIQEGQEEFVDALRDQEETGWVRTQSTRGMRGMPSVRLHYAYEFPRGEGKRLVVLVTDRNIGFVEAATQTRSSDYDISAIVMELQTGEDGKEKGQGVLYLATTLAWDAHEKKLVVESFGTQPVKLPEINRHE
jgi:hypothetical protein